MFCYIQWDKVFDLAGLQLNFKLREQSHPKIAHQSLKAVLYLAM